MKKNNIENGDVVSLGGEFLEVIKIDGELLTLAGGDRPTIQVEKEYVVLVCKAKNREDHPFSSSLNNQK